MGKSRVWKSSFRVHVPCLLLEESICFTMMSSDAHQLLLKGEGTKVPKKRTQWVLESSLGLLLWGQKELRKSPILLTHLNKHLKRAKKESLSHYWRVTVGVVYGLGPTGCPTILLPIGRSKHAVEKIKPEMFPSKFPKLGENLKSPLYGNIKIMDKDSSLKILFGRTGKMMNWSKYKKQLNMTIHIVCIPLN